MEHAFTMAVVDHLDHLLGHHCKAGFAKHKLVLQHRAQRVAPIHETCAIPKTSGLHQQSAWGSGSYATAACQHRCTQSSWTGTCSMKCWRSPPVHSSVTIFTLLLSSKQSTSWMMPGSPCSMGSRGWIQWRSIRVKRTLALACTQASPCHGGQRHCSCVATAGRCTRTCKLSRMSTSRANFSSVFSIVSLPRTLGRLLIATSLPCKAGGNGRVTWTQANASWH